ncbi:hypothetical protein E3Q09_01523 [Wallemia mellicola]|nr:hypothetical protein E3Q09_01523 [Wallemia mellicola]
MGFTGDNGGFSFGGNSSPTATEHKKADRPTHGRRHSHRRHSSVSTRRDSMQLMSGNQFNESFLDNLDTAGPSNSQDVALSKEDETALENGFVSASNSLSSDGFLVMPTSQQIDQLSDNSDSSPNSPSASTTFSGIPTPQSQQIRRPSPMSISQMPQPLGALMEEEEDDEDGSTKTSRQSKPSFKTYKTKRNSVDFDSIMRTNGGPSAGNRPIRPLSMSNSTGKSPFNFTSRVSQPPTFQRSGSSSSESLSLGHSQSSIASSISSPFTSMSFGKSADFDYGGMPPIPSGSTSSSSTTPPRRQRGSIQYRRSDDIDDSPASQVSNKNGPKPLNLVNKARSGSNSSNTSTETSDLFNSSPSNKAFLEQQLTTTLEDLSIWRDKNAALERDLSIERKERLASEERVKRLGEKLNQLPNLQEYQMQIQMINEMREQLFYLSNELEEFKKVNSRSQEEISELRSQLREKDQREGERKEREREKEKEIKTEKEKEKLDTEATNQDEEKPVRPHSLLIDWRFPMSANNNLSPKIDEDEEELEEPSPTVDYNDAFAHNSSMSFGKGSVDDENFGLPPISTPPAQVRNDNFGFVRSRSNSLLNKVDKVRNSFSPSPKYEKTVYVNKEKQLDKLSYDNNNEMIDFAPCYLQAGYNLTEV